VPPTKCPNCGAPSPVPTPDPSVFRCNFCETTFREAPQPQAPVIVVRSGGSGAGIAIVLVGILVAFIAIGGVVALVLVRSGGESKSTPPASKKVAATTEEPETTVKPSKASKSATKPAVPTSDGPKWASDRVFPIGVDIDGDGAEDLVGPSVQSDGANAQLYVSAWDGKTFAHKYRVGPFGAAGKSDVERTMPVVVAGKRFVVLDPKGDAHLYELADGKLVVDFPFREEHRGMCGPPANEPKVLVRVGKGDFIIDTATAKGANGAPPAWCAGDKYMRRRPSESFNNYYGAQYELIDFNWNRDRYALLKKNLPPKMSLRFAFADGPTTIGVLSTQGSEETTLAGFEANGTIKYQVAGGPLGLNADHHRKELAFDRLVYSRSDKKLVSVDAKTGEKQWETDLPEIGRDVLRIDITATRVWITRRNESGALVMAIDATNGKVLGTAGQ